MCDVSQSLSTRPDLAHLHDYHRWGKVPHNFMSSAGDWSDARQAEEATVSINRLIRHFKTHVMGLEVHT